jgi:2-hydroxy-6-oxonona-2,4-dienedioate hydrolase
LSVRTRSLTEESLVINTDAGLIEYADKGAGIPSCRSMAPAAASTRASPMQRSLWAKAFESLRRRVSDICERPSRGTPLQPAQADAHAALLSKLNLPNAIVVGVSAGARSAVELAIRHPETVAGLILIVPGTYSPASPVSIEPSRGNRFTFWVVNFGGNFAWWIAEKIAPSMLIRFLGVRPELVGAAPRAERDRVISIVKSIEPLSLRFPGINIDSTTTLRELPLEKITAPTLIISARDDGFNTLPAAEFTASRIRGAKLVVYDTGGHLLVGHGKTVRATVHSFLAAAGVHCPVVT